MPLSITVQLRYDILKNDGYFAVFFFGVSLLKVKIKFISFDIKTKKFKLMFNQKEFSAALTPKSDKESVLNYLTSPLLSIIDFIYFDIDFTFGKKNDAFLTMLVAQTVGIAIDAFTSVLKSSQELETEKHIVPDYGKDTLKISYDGIISASVANIIYSFFYAIKLKNRKAEQKTAVRLKERNT